MQLSSPNYAWKIETNEQRLLNKNCRNGVSSTSLVSNETMGQHVGKRFFFFWLPFVIYQSGFDLFNLSNFWKIYFMDSLDILCLETPWKNCIK